MTPQSRDFAASGTAAVDARHAGRHRHPGGRPRRSTCRSCWPCCAASASGCSCGTRRGAMRCAPWATIPEAARLCRHRAAAHDHARRCASRGGAGGLGRRQRADGRAPSHACSTSPAGYGFAGIAVALMGRNHPVGIVLAALLFGALYQGGAELAFEIPTITREMVVVIQGLIILFSGALANMPRPWLQAAASRCEPRAAWRERAVRWTISSSLVVLMLAATLRVATPLVLCAMGGLFSETQRHHRCRARRQDADGGVLRRRHRRAVTGSAWAGVAAAIVAAEVLALLHGFACITHRGNQVVSGVAINIIAAGLTVVLGTAWFNRGGQTPRPGAASAAPAAAARCRDRRRQHPGLLPRCSRCRSPGGSSSARASACGCAPSARSRWPSTPPASRCRGCAIARCCCAACSRPRRRLSRRSRRMPASAAT